MVLAPKKNEHNHKIVSRIKKSENLLCKISRLFKKSLIGGDKRLYNLIKHNQEQ